ncbi:hypothetical protein NDU88_007013 [Pleurodeles waltl]|uniref:Uncharacterized protein n=1 Tax=Pleurodeles waltl TaxID=8319 RepID=A0AAV7MF48_PLEWA|nr:hypothetical protein NDU88_007013 [Pleurodeles waltl]
MLALPSILERIGHVVFTKGSRRLDYQTAYLTVLGTRWCLPTATNPPDWRPKRKGLVGTCAGRYLAVIGRYQAATGRYLAATGRYLAATGRYLAATGRYLAATGRYLAATGRYLAATGRYLAATGRYLAATGRCPDVHKRRSDTPAACRTGYNFPTLQPPFSKHPSGSSFRPRHQAPQTMEEPGVDAKATEMTQSGARQDTWDHSAGI